MLHPGPYRASIGLFVTVVLLTGALLHPPVALAGDEPSVQPLPEASVAYTMPFVRVMVSVPPGWGAAPKLSGDGWGAREATTDQTKALGYTGAIDMTSSSIRQGADEIPALLSAELESSKKLVEAGQYSVAEEKVLNGVKGIYVVEAAGRFSKRSIRWHTMLAGGDCTVMMTASNEEFERYAPLFHRVLESVEVIPVTEK